jgi:HEAT repeat protein
VNLDEAAKQAEELANAGDERGLAQLRSTWDDELEAAARHTDYRIRGVAYRALAQFRFRAKLELLRRGLDDESPVVRGSAIMSLESLSRGHPGDVQKFRPLLHTLASGDPNAAVRRLAIVCFRNGAPDPATISILDSIAADDEGDAEVRKTARAVALLLVKKRNTKAK